MGRRRVPRRFAWGRPPERQCEARGNSEEAGGSSTYLCRNLAATLSGLPRKTV